MSALLPDFEQGFLEISCEADRELIIEKILLKYPMIESVKDVSEEAIEVVYLKMF